MPTRLLDVSHDKPGPDSHDNVRLVISNVESVHNSHPYAALSYCWGNDLDGVVRTKKANLESFRHGIPLDSLPQTLQDAVTVCRGLHIHYLWVDALCIVQDDVDDWRREAAQMHQIYSSSRITIAAHAPVSCQDGFLGDQSYGQSSWQQPFSTEFWTSADEDAFGPTTPVTMYIRMGEPPNQSTVEPSPLTRRGWTLQEGILPRRTIHFTGAELVWECATRHFCECGHVEGLSSDGGTPMVGTEVLHGHRYDHRKELVKDGWMRLVEKYTARTLSYTSDKLIAVSGLAQMVELVSSLSPGSPRNEHERRRSSGTKYLAGVFRAALPRHLLWHAQDRDTDVPEGAILDSQSRPTPYRAPTWSWASIDTPVLYPSGLFDSDETPYITLHDERCFCIPLVQADPTGAVVSGELVVAGPVVPVKLVTAERQEKENVWEVTDNWNGRASIVRTRSGWKEEVACDMKRPVEVRKEDPCYECWCCPWGPSYAWCNKCEGMAADWTTPEHCCLKVASYRGSFETSTFFLVLERSKTIEGAWERVGIGMVESSNSDNGLNDDEYESTSEDSLQGTPSGDVVALDSDIDESNDANSSDGSSVWSYTSPSVEGTESYGSEERIKPFGESCLVMDGTDIVNQNAGEGSNAQNDMSLYVVPDMTDGDNDIDLFSGAEIQMLRII